MKKAMLMAAMILVSGGLNGCAIPAGIENLIPPLIGALRGQPATATTPTAPATGTTPATTPAPAETPAVPAPGATPVGPPPPFGFSGDASR